MMILKRWLSAVVDWVSGFSTDTVTTLAFLAFLSGVVGVLGVWWALLIGGGLVFVTLCASRVLGWDAPDEPVETEGD